MKTPESIKRLGGWYRGHKKPVWITVVVVLVVQVAVQFVYPYGRALPFASVLGQSVSFQTRTQVVKTLQTSFADATVTLTAGDKTVQYSLQNLGATVDADEMAAHTTTYPFVIRAVPFSLLWYQPDLDRYRLNFEADVLASKTDDIAKQLTLKATDASLTIEKDELAIVAAEPGQKVTAEQVRSALQTSRFSDEKTAVTVGTTSIEPSVSDASIAQVRSEAEAVLAQKITIGIDGKTFSPERKDVASWLTITQSKKTKSPELGINQKKVSTYVESLNKQIRKNPTATKVSLVDGREVSRKTGKTGSGLSNKAATAQLVTVLETPNPGGVALAFTRVPIKPPIDYNRTYRSTYAGLQAYVKDMSTLNDIHMSVTQLEGNGWSASGRGDESIPAASTYKPYVLLKLFDDIKKGKKDWDDPILDTTISGCVDRTIVTSSNPCVEKLIEDYGVNELTKYVQGRGFSKGTGFNFPKVTQTTANDLNKLMVGIETGSLLGKPYRNILLEKMGKQIYRQGVPAGTSAPVYNKVGFLWDYLHDAAIVRHPEGTYVIVIMTKGESWGKIAEITREVERILYS